MFIFTLAADNHVLFANLRRLYQRQARQETLRPWLVALVLVLAPAAAIALAPGPASTLAAALVNLAGGAP